MDHSIEIEKILDTAEDNLLNHNIEKVEEICNDVLKKYDEINSISLYRIGFLLSYIGQIDKSEKIWQDAINVTVKDNDKYNRSFILHNIATIKANLGNTEEASYLWNEALNLKNEISDLKGSAVTLNNLAWLSKIKNDNVNEIDLLLKASSIFAELDLWNELADNLIKLYDAENDKDRKINYLLQAFYISTKIKISSKDFLYILVNLINTLGMDNKYSKYFAGVSIFINNSEDHEISEISQKILIAIALTDNVKDELINQWIIDNKLNDSDILISNLEKAYEELTKNNEWIFIPEKLNV